MQDRRVYAWIVSHTGNWSKRSGENYYRTGAKGSHFPTLHPRILKQDVKSFRISSEPIAAADGPRRIFMYMSWGKETAAWHTSRRSPAGLRSSGPSRPTGRSCVGLP